MIRMHHRFPLTLIASLASLCLLLTLAGAARAGSPIDDYGPVPDFRLKDTHNQPVTRADLLGKVWIASFVFTRCTGECPQVSTTMRQLQDDFARQGDVRLVTFTVDPEHDDPQELNRYAERFGADPHRWLFLTGTESEIDSLLRDGFHVTAQRNEGKDSQPGREFMHDQRLVLVDREGHIRGYFDGMPNRYSPSPEDDFKKNLRDLRREVGNLTHETWYVPRDFPRFNATLNALSAMLLFFGYTAIRRRLVRLHTTCMLAALVVSAVFLTGYLYFHIVIRQGQPTSFAEQTREANPPSWVGQLYLGILLSHTVLAVVAAPLALVTAYLGLRGRLVRHVAIARWTLPIWMYVSVTGVVVYWMLYRLYPPS
jgi:protein SCO1/2